jgi:intracellular septation protein
MKALLDLLPALAFFGAYLAADIYAATIALVVSLFIVVAIYRIWKREWHKAHLATAIVAAVLGGLTLYIHDPAFIKLKPTVVYALFSLALLGSHVIGDRVLMARIPQQTIQLPPAVWRRVNFAWAVFFALCAVLNLYIAHQFDEATWVKFKTFGFTALMFVFMLAHAPFLTRYLQQNDAQS